MKYYKKEIARRVSTYSLQEVRIEVIEHKV